jgi:murein DD-endopeptidase MepM/ murein hydrolase activator NlpD
LESYAIFGRPVLAVADAVVAATVDGAPEQVPGKYPTNIIPSQADGNCVILDLGGGRFAMYAHMQPGSLKVRKGDKVKVGQVLGLVGDSGNSLVPHLHFQVMDRASSLGSNGLPYEIREFEVTGETPGTAAFDEAEEKGTPLTMKAMEPAQKVNDALPLDQLIISFAPAATTR